LLREQDAHHQDRADRNPKLPGAPLNIRSIT
jgi:hypothetical protein